MPVLAKPRVCQLAVQYLPGALVWVFLVQALQRFGVFPVRFL